MDAVKRYFKNSSPLVKMLMAISITSGLIALNKLYYAPYKRRSRLLRAEEWASRIIEREEEINNE